MTEWKLHIMLLFLSGCGLLWCCYVILKIVMVHTENLNSHKLPTLFCGLCAGPQQTFVYDLPHQVYVCTSTPWWRALLPWLLPRPSWVLAIATLELKSSSMSTESTTWSYSPLLFWISWTKTSTLSPCVFGRVLLHWSYKYIGCKGFYVEGLNW